VEVVYATVFRSSILFLVTSSLNANIQTSCLDMFLVTYWIIKLRSFQR